MPELQINCVIQENNVITTVGIGDKVYAVQTVVDWLNANKENRCYTFKDNKKAEVVARKHKETGKWYLTTNPDDTRMNNLDFLDSCK
ncbi:MAG: DUF3892 domain-containing protein [Thaumarchaeota archaeon]|nr:DUF3892 domain-containing protein [Nitrososphaerota archaeon]